MAIIASIDEAVTVKQIVARRGEPTIPAKPTLARGPSLCLSAGQDKGDDRD